jgi:hypothetical protein
MKRSPALKCEFGIRKTSFVLFLVSTFNNFSIKLKKEFGIRSCDIAFRKKVSKMC